MQEYEKTIADMIGNYLVLLDTLTVMLFSLSYIMISVSEEKLLVIFCAKRTLAKTQIAQKPFH